MIVVVDVMTFVITRMSPHHSTGTSHSKLLCSPAFRAYKLMKQMHCKTELHTKL